MTPFKLAARNHFQLAIICQSPRKKSISQSSDLRVASIFKFVRKNNKVKAVSSWSPTIHRIPQRPRSLCQLKESLSRSWEQGESVVLLQNDSQRSVIRFGWDHATLPPNPHIPISIIAPFVSCPPKLQSRKRISASWQFRGITLSPPYSTIHRGTTKFWSIAPIRSTTNSTD